jgi:formate dehydrogenase major subunit
LGPRRITRRDAGGYIELISPAKISGSAWRLAVLNDLLSRWPLIQQIRTGADGTGPEAMSERTRTLRTKHESAEVTPSICPYCGVGCGQLVYHRRGKLISIEGDPGSPISRGRLCPKGADTYELHTHPGRLRRVKYRRPNSCHWEEMDLETAMDMVTERVWQSRECSFQETREGEPLMQTAAIAHLGGATLDIEENYLIKKLFTGGLGMVCLSNQARI